MMMKKLFYIALAVVTMGLIVSCAPKTPGAAAKSLMEAAAAGDYDKFIDGVAMDGSAEEIEQSKTMLKALMTEKAAPEMEKKGGLKSVEVVEETIAEDGQSATVKLKSVFGDGTEEEDSQNMVLVDGVWKMEMDK